MSTPPTATCYAAEIMIATAAMIARAPTYVQASGANDAPAWDRIILLDGGQINEDQQQQRAPSAQSATGTIINLGDGKAWAHIAPRMPEQSTEDPAYRSYRRQGQIHVRIAAAITGAHPAEKIINALNIFGQIEQEILEQFQAPYALIAGNVSFALEGIPAPSSWARNLRFALYTIDWRDVP